MLMRSTQELITIWVPLLPSRQYDVGNQCGLHTCSEGGGGGGGGGRGGGGGGRDAYIYMLMHCRRKLPLVVYYKRKCVCHTCRYNYADAL